MDFPKQAVGSFTNGSSGQKSFRDFRETGPWSLVEMFLVVPGSTSQLHL